MQYQNIKKHSFTDKMITWMLQPELHITFLINLNIYKLLVGCEVLTTVAKRGSIFWDKCHEAWSTCGIFQKTEVFDSDCKMSTKVMIENRSNVTPKKRMSDHKLLLHFMSKHGKEYYCQNLTKGQNVKMRLKQKLLITWKYTIHSRH